MSASPDPAATRAPAAPANASREPIDTPARAALALAARARVAAIEHVSLAHATGRVLAREISLDRPSPACDVSAMDGYAVRLAALAPGSDPRALIRAVVAAECRIGRPPIDMPALGVARIVTGAPVPAGADAIIKREDVREHGDAIDITPAALAAARPGQFIRRRGENAPAGAPIVAAGRVITPPIVGVLATVGLAQVAVHRRVRVGVLVTGDELVGPDIPDASPADWQVRDSNGPALASMFANRPFVGLTAVRREIDEPGRLAIALRELLDDADAVFITGGVSMGERDFVPAVVKGLDGQIVFHTLPQRPGRPMLGAALPDGRLIMGLPGNPVSVLVTARRIGMSVVESIAGVSTPATPSGMALLRNADAQRLHLWWHRLVRIVAPGEAELVGTKGSGDVVSAAASDGFVELPPDAAGPGPWPLWRW